MRTSAEFYNSEFKYYEVQRNICMYGSCQMRASDLTCSGIMQVAGRIAVDTDDRISKWLTGRSRPS